MTDQTLQMSKKVLRSLLEEIPPEFLQDMLNEIKEGREHNGIEGIPFSELMKFNGFLELGGNALVDSEKLYDG